MITIHDVAKAAGVSIATVSYALNGHKKVSAKTKERVRQIAEQLGYTPNPLAKGLLSRRSEMIGLIVPGDAIVLPYLYSIILQLEQHARRNGLYLLLGNSDGKVHKELEVVRDMMAKRVDALIVIPGGAVPDAAACKQYRQLVKRNVPIVFFGHRYSGIDSNSIAPDLEHGTYAATRLLLEQGHRDIALIGGRPEHASVVQRSSGIRQAFAEAGQMWQDRFHDKYGGGYTFRDGYIAGGQLAEDRSALPSAILAVNDFVALGLYKALNEQSIRVPQDISLIGCDDIDFPTVETFPLTTLRIPVEQMCRLCIEHCLQLRNDPGLTFQISLQPELIVRDSVKMC